MPKPRAQILVCVNQRAPGARRACCGSRNGLKIYQRFKDEIKGRGLKGELLATRTGCLKYCSLGVVVTLWPWNLWYGNVTLDDVEQIVDQVANGDDQPIERLLVPEDAPWE